MTSELEIPSRSDSWYRKWKMENTNIMGWLLNFMKPKISDHFLFLETSHQIWDALGKSYSQMGYIAKVYELRQNIAQFKQGDKPLALYYSSLRKI